MHRWGVIILGLQAVSACAMLPRDLDPNAFHEGMTRTELTVASGLPGKIHVKANREIWQYCARGLFGMRATSLVNVLFVSGRVAHFDFHPDSRPRDCEDLYLAFSWDTAAYQPSYK